MKKKLFSFIAFLSLITLNSGSVKAFYGSPKYTRNIKGGPYYEMKLNDLYKEQEEIVQVLSYSEDNLSITENDIYLMAQVVYAESRSEPYSGQLAVASVIINRLKHPKFPKTVEGVVKQRYAFSCIRNGKIDVVPDEQSYKAVLEALKGNDPTKKAVFFYNPKIATSTWMKKVDKKNVKVIGNHVFFQ